MKVTLIGASGFVGPHLAKALRARGDVVVEASLRDVAKAAAACEGAGAVVNLAGTPVSQRWTPEVKKSILASRTDAPGALIDAFGALSVKPKQYVTASAIGYYGISEDATFTESSPHGTDYLAEVCVGWEATAKRAEAHGMRVTAVRIGLVLGKDGGALAKLLPLFKFGAGGIVASGKQWYSWVHIDDVVGLFLHALDGAEGPLNATAPVPVRNADFTKALGHAVRRPTILPTPRFAIELVFGDGAVIVTEGQRVVPEHSEATGYAFKYRTIDSAFAEIVGA